MVTPKVYVQESKIQFVFDAVYAFAHALHRMTADVCGHMRSRRSRRRCLRGLDGLKLYKKYLLNVSFDGKRSPANSLLLTCAVGVMAYSVNYCIKELK